LNGAGVSSGWPWLGRSGRVSLRPNRADDGYGHGSRDANRKVFHRTRPLLDTRQRVHTLAQTAAYNSQARARGRILDGYAPLLA